MRAIISFLSFIIGLSIALPTWAVSTIDPTQPLSGQPYTSAPIRNNFQAAVNDIQALQKLNSAPIAPVNPSLGTFWLNTSSATNYPLEIWDGTNWVVIAALDTINHLWNAPLGGGTLPTLLSATTTDLGTVPAASLYISGANSIQSFGSTMPTGGIKVTLFTGTATLVQNATSLILPGAANIVQQAGDISIELALGGGNWQVIFDSRVLQSCAPAGGFSCTTINAKTAAYTALSSDCGNTIELGGSAFYALTINSAASYLSNCQLVIVNTDTTRGKQIIISGGATTILWPLQTTTYYSTGTSWNVPARPRWRLAGATTFYVDPVNGNDTQNDCLAALTAACQTVQGTINAIQSFMDLNGQFLTISLVQDTTPGDYKPFSVNGPWVGITDVNGIIVTGATNNPALYLLDGQGAGSCINIENFGILWIQNLTVQNCGFLIGGGKSVLDARRTSPSHIALSNVAVGSCATSVASPEQIYAADGTYIEIRGAYQIINSTNCAAHYGATRGAQILVDAAFTGTTVATVTANLSYSLAFAAVARSSSLTFLGFSASPFVLGGHTVSGLQFLVEAAATIQNGVSAAFFPGTSSMTLDSATYNPQFHDLLPTIGASACGGGSPSILTGSTDYAGYITEGTSVTTCTITFGFPFLVAPLCMVTPSSAATNLYAIASTTGLAITHGSTSGATETYFCHGG